MFWGFSFIFGYLIFRSYFKPESKRFLKKITFVTGGFALVLLTAISISRFQTSDSNVINGLIDYFGQPLNNFGQLFDKVHDYQGTRIIFPWLYGSSGYSGKEAVTETVDFYNKYGFNSNSFFTFIGTLYYAWGAWGTLFVALFYALF